MRIQKGYEILKTEQIVFVLKKTGEYMTLKSSFSRCPYSKIEQPRVPFNETRVQI
jgi:DNA-binding transcriptional regulator YhcF (GntR family)